MIIINEGKTLNLSLFAPIVTNDLEWTVSYFDTQKGCTGCSTCDTQKEDEGTNDGADPSVILTAPDTNTNTTIFTKSVKYLNVYNADTTTNTVTITLDSKVIFKTVLPSGYNLVYNEESGWTVYTNYGGPAGGGSSVPVSVSPTYYARMADDGSGLVNGWIYQDGTGVLVDVTKTITATNGTDKTSTFDFNSGRLAMIYTNGAASSFIRLFPGYFVINGTLGSQIGSDGSGNISVNAAGRTRLIGATGIQMYGAVDFGSPNTTDAITGVTNWYNSTNDFKVTIQSGVTSAGYTLTLPTAQSGGANYALVNDGSGVLSWVAMGTGTITSVSGTLNRITSSGGSAPVIDISGSYVGQVSIITLGTVTTGNWSATTIAANKGGTGFSSYAVGDLLYADTTSTLAKLADVATGNALISGGVTTAPSWGKIALTTHISGVLPVANGGTNASSASIAAFNNITGYTAAGATGTTSTNLVFSTSPNITTPTFITKATTPNITTTADNSIDPIVVVRGTNSSNFFTAVKTGFTDATNLGAYNDANGAASIYGCNMYYSDGGGEFRNNTSHSAWSIVLDNRSAGDYMKVFRIAAGGGAAAELLKISSTGTLTFIDAGNFVFGTTTGTKLGTSTSQKIGAFNATPIVQPAAVTTTQGLYTAMSNLGWIAAGTISGVSSYAHNISTPTTGGTVTLTNNQFNIINPAGALLTLTINLPSSPSNNDVVYIKYTQNITTVTYANGTVADGITAPTAGGLVVLVYDSGTTTWY